MSNAKEWSSKNALSKKSFASGKLYIPIGYDGDTLYVLIRKTGQLHKFTMARLTRLNLLLLAPNAYWESEHGGKQGGVQWHLAAEQVLSECRDAGFFSEDRIRGRGAWHDNGRILIHAGERVYVAGTDEEMPLADASGRYVYDLRPKIEARTIVPGEFEPYILYEALQRVPFTRKLDMALMCGWCVIAPVCGVLRFRPHIWLEGRAGSGKSWTLEKIILRALGGWAVYATGNTSDAGYRQYLGREALPVVKDENDAENRKALEDIQSVLDFIRTNSTSDGAKIIKGTSGGSALATMAQSCFLLSGTVNMLKRSADLSRFATIVFEKRVGQEAAASFRELKKFVNDNLTETYCENLRAWAIQNLVTILRSIDVFTDALADVTGDARTADLYASLLGPYFVVCKKRLPTVEEAKAFVVQQDWKQAQLYREEAEPIGCMQQILNHFTEIEWSSSGQRVRARLLVGELIQLSSGIKKQNPLPESLLQADARAHLNQIGIQADPAEDPIMYVSTQHFQIERILSTGEGIHRKSYKNLLKHHPAYVDLPAHKARKTFAGGMQTRVLAFSIKRLFSPPAPFE